MSRTYRSTDVRPNIEIPERLIAWAKVSAEEKAVRSGIETHIHVGYISLGRLRRAVRGLKKCDMVR